MTKRALVLGAGGFIGGHLVKRLKAEGYWVAGADLKAGYFSGLCDFWATVDLRSPSMVFHLIDEPFDEVYQLAADMGGAGYLFSGAQDFAIMSNSALINLNVTRRLAEVGAGKVFFASSACVYPEFNQEDPDDPHCAEDTVYPALPDSEYGWEKLFGERLYAALRRQHGIDVKIGRFHNVFGPQGTWTGGKEKAPAAICRKVAECEDGDVVVIWGDGRQTRSFLYVDEAIEAVRRLMASDFGGPVNIGSEEMVSINRLVAMVAKIAGKIVKVKNVPGPQGVRGRTSDNALIEETLGWRPTAELRAGLETTYAWIARQVAQEHEPA